MGMFYIDTSAGEFATHEQLRAHGLLNRDGRSRPPWHRIQATSDASTLWYALMRKHTRGIWLGALTMRGAEHYEKLLREGWEEVPPQHTGASLGAAPKELAPAPFDADSWEKLHHRLHGPPEP